MNDAVEEVPLLRRMVLHCRHSLHGVGLSLLPEGYYCSRGINPPELAGKK